MLHCWKSAALWAPFFVGCRYGPSTCAPSREAELGMSLGTREGRVYKRSVSDGDSHVAKVLDVVLKDQLLTV